MKIAGARKQALFLTGINGVVRALGMIMRIWMSRILGAEVMGVMELAQSVHMVAITPLTSGLPVALSRLTARSASANKEKALEAGIWLVRRISLLIIPAFWLLSPMISHWMGDIRVLPSLWFTAPCILILGYSASYNGYCYGIERSELPALSELIEQLVRFILTFILIHTFRHLTTPWLAAIPTASTMAAEIIGLMFVLYHLPLKQPLNTSSTDVKNVFRLSAPATVTRLIQTLLRSVTALIIPLQLQTSGLAASEATAQLGMLNGMVGPFLMLPGIFTSALSMVLVPRMAKAEEQPHEMKRLLLISICCLLPTAGICALAVYCGSSWIAIILYHQPELTRLFQMCALQIVLMPVNHLLGSVLSALGQQRRSMILSVVTAISTLFLTWLWAGNSALRIAGVVRAQYFSYFLSIILNVLALYKWRHERRDQI